jgi:hypothetical protein
MAKTLPEMLDEIKKLPPAERIKKLLELKKDVKDAMEKRQKEFEEAEKVAIVEVKKEAEEKEKIKEEEEQTIKTLQPAVRPAPAEEINLEEILLSEKKTEVEAPANYGKIIDEIKTTLYDVAPIIYQGMQELRNKASEGELSDNDRKRFRAYNEMISQLSNVSPDRIKNKETKENLLKMQYAMRQTEQYSSERTKGGY